MDENLLAKARIYYRKMAHISNRRDEAEDMLHYWVMKRLEGRITASFYQLGVDYLRETSGQVGVTVPRKRDKSLEIIWSRHVTSIKDSDGEIVPILDLMPSEVDSLTIEERIDLCDVIRRMDWEERVKDILYLYVEGLTLKEIGKVLGLTESRVSQLLIRSPNRIRINGSFIEIAKPVDLSKKADPPVELPEVEVHEIENEETFTNQEDRKMFEKLSAREKEVAQEVVLGKSNKEVANKLFVTEKTVKFHLTNIYSKLKIKSRSQLIIMGMTHRQECEDRKEPAVISAKPEAPKKEELPRGHRDLAEAA